MDPNYSKAALLAFIDTAERQGLFNPNTAGAYKAAAIRLLEDVSSENDVRGVDIEAATIKYHNKHPGVLAPKSLRTYQNRLKRLIGEFAKYVGSPAEYKPRMRMPRKPQRERPTKATAPVVRNMYDAEVVEPDDAEYEAIPIQPSLDRSTSALAMAYPLREDFVAQVVLPRNLTTDEARRLCAFIRTLAADFTPPKDM